MTVIVFIIVLAVLILVHEAGHFFAAKWSGMRVDEFGLGFPPQAASTQPDDSETTYSLNWLPFGGFVKIFGEDLEDIDEDHPDKDRAFSSQSAFERILVLVAGVIMNMLLAYLLLSLSFMVGKTVLDTQGNEDLRDPRVVITQILPDTPAEKAGIEPGSEIRSLSAGSKQVATNALNPKRIQQIVSSATNTPVRVTTKLGSTVSAATLTPTTTDEGLQIGIAMAQVGTLQTGFFEAFVRGADATISLTKRTVAGFYNLIQRAITEGGGLGQVAGPVGIAELVGQAADRGLAPLLSFVALISVNLAILNLLPFPALDGGRIMFVLWEVVSGRKVPATAAKWANGIGLALLLLFMLVITYKDIVGLL